MDIIFNTPGIGGIIYLMVITMFTSGYYFALRWIIKGKKENRD